METNRIDSASHSSLGREDTFKIARQSDEALYLSSLASEKKSIISGAFQMVTAIPSKIWSCITWVFETIFFCFSYAPQIPGKTDLERLKNEQKKFVTLRDEFHAKKANASFNRNEFKTWWAGVFHSLPQIMKEKIVKESLRDNARAKGYDTPEGQNGFIALQYQNAEQRDKALSYVRDLKMQSTEKLAWDPIDDTQLPKFLGDIISQLDAVIKKSNA